MEMPKMSLFVRIPLLVSAVADLSFSYASKYTVMELWEARS